MRSFVKVEKVEAGTISSSDRAVFSKVRIFTNEAGELIVSFNYENVDYFNTWLTRVNGLPISSDKGSLRMAIESDVGDTKDRIADCFKLTQFCMIMISELYNLVDPDSITDIKVKELFTIFNTIKASSDLVFNIDLKESYSSEFTKLLNREISVANLIKTNESVE